MQRFYSPRGAQGTTRRDAAWVYRRERQPVECWLAERGDMESLRIKKLIAADVASGKRQQLKQEAGARQMPVRRD
jgi:hypothetical protein